MKNIVKVKIYNRPFNLSTDDSEGYIRKISGIVDTKVRGIISAAPGTNIIDAAILTALEAVDEKQKAFATIDNLRSQIKDYVDDAGEARLKCDEAQKELRDLRAKVSELEKEVEIRRMFNKKLETEAAVAAQKIKDAEEKAKAATLAAESEKKKIAEERAQNLLKQQAEEKAKADARAKAAKALEDAKAAARAKAAATNSNTSTASSTSTAASSSSSIPPVTMPNAKKDGLY